jgi:GMP synthase (glutamine-hydrolysing)
MRIAKLVVLCFLALLFVDLPVHATGSAAASPGDITRELQSSAPLEPSSTWIVVNLFTGQSSKQAVIVKETLERLGAEGRGIVLPYRDITVENMERLRPAFLALSPNGVPWCRYTGRNGAELKSFFQALRVIVEDMQVPVIGVCGGHQALALAFGGKVGPIVGGEDDCFPYGKNPTERGRHDLNVLAKDPLFLGMGPTINLVQNHYDEVKRVPQGFVTLAANKLCGHQIIRHPSRPAYGVQAHTEYYMTSRPDGGTLLRNFLHIARTHNRIARGVGGSSPRTETDRQATVGKSE